MIQLERKHYVSVIMAAYNAEKFIEDAVNSILSQTYDFFELIIVDDASTDATGVILKSFSDSRVRVFTNENNMRLAYSLNYAISKSRGEFIARMDADDIAEPNRLEQQLIYLLNNEDIDLVGANALSFGDVISKMNYPANHDSITCHLLFENAFCHPAVMFRKKDIFKYDQFCTAAQDYKLWASIIFKIRTANIQKVLLNYRIHGKQTKHILGTKQKEGELDAKRIMLNYLDSDENIDRNKYFVFTNHNQVLNAQQLLEYDDMLKQIILINDAKHVFSKDALEKTCVKQFMECLYISLKAKKISAKEYLQIAGIRRLFCGKFTRIIKIIFLLIRSCIWG